MAQGHLYGVSNEKQIYYALPVYVRLKKTKQKKTGVLCMTINYNW